MEVRVATGRRRWRRPRVFDVENWLYKTLSNGWCGNTCPPMDNRKYKWFQEDKFADDDYYVFSQGEDGHEMWIGHAHEWYFHLELKRFRYIALWTIYQWFVVDWFGLRTWLWWKLLFKQCDRTKKALVLVRGKDGI